MIEKRLPEQREKDKEVAETVIKEEPPLFLPAVY